MLDDEDGFTSSAASVLVPAADLPRTHRRDHGTKDTCPDPSSPSLHTRYSGPTAIFPLSLLD